MAKRVSMIPNFFTMSNMLMGFLAIILTSKNDPALLAVAGILVFIGSIFDATDGAVARALKVQSPIGSQLDSLADAITYGMAPGIIAYKFSLHHLPVLFSWLDLGMIIAAIFPVCAVYRLARFNITHEESGFTGLPSPPAGILISIIPSLAYSKIFWFGKINFSMSVELFSIIYCIIALLMISVIDYRKLFSDLYHKGKFVSFLTLVIIVLLLIFFQTWAIAVFTLLYVILGIFKYCIKIIKNVSRK